MNTLYRHIMDELDKKANANLNSTFEISRENSEKIFIIPPKRTRYLSEIAENNRSYDEKAASQSEVAQKLYGIYKTILTVADVRSSGVETIISTKMDWSNEEILEQAQKDDNDDFLEVAFR